MLVVLFLLGPSVSSYCESRNVPANLSQLAGVINYCLLNIEISISNVQMINSLAYLGVLRGKETGIFKRTPQRCKDPALWVWLEILLTPKEAPTVKPLIFI